MRGGCAIIPALQLLEVPRLGAVFAFYRLTVYRYTGIVGRVISGFADQTTEDIFHGVDSKSARSVPKDVWPVARRQLDMLNAAHELRDLRSPPGNRLEALKGSLAGKYSVRINDQFRVVFSFGGGNAGAVQILDYH